MQTFNEAKAIALEKQLEQNFEACEEQIQPADYRNASQEAVRYEVGTATSTMQVRSQITQGAQCEELEKNSNLSDHIYVG